VTVSDEKEIERFHVVSLHQYIPENLIVPSAALDGEDNALEVIPVAFVHQVIPKAFRDQIRRIVEGSAAKGAEDEIVRAIGGRHLQDVVDPMIEGIRLSPSSSIT
jgi:hypothetical protein